MSRALIEKTQLKYLKPPTSLEPSTRRIVRRRAHTLLFRSVRRSAQQIPLKVSRRSPARKWHRFVRPRHDSRRSERGAGRGWWLVSLRSSPPEGCRQCRDLRGSCRCRYDLWRHGCRKARASNFCRSTVPRFSSRLPGVWPFVDGVQEVVMRKTARPSLENARNPCRVMPDTRFGAAKRVTDNAWARDRLQMGLPQRHRNAVLELAGEDGAGEVVEEILRSEVIAEPNAGNVELTLPSE